MRDLWSTGVLSGQLPSRALHAQGMRMVLSALLAMACTTQAAHAGVSEAGQVGPPNEIYTVRFYLHLLHENNVLETTDEFELGVRVECSSNVTGITVTPPGGTATPLVPDRDTAGVWVEAEEFVFDSPPIGTYGLTFDFASGGTDSASVFFDPPAPGGIGIVTSPVHDLCTPLGPAFTWTSVEGMGSKLFADLSADDAGDSVELPMTATSWDPGMSLLPGTQYEFGISVVQGIGSFFQTAVGEQVFFGQNMLFDNTIHFTTCLPGLTLEVPVMAHVAGFSSEQQIGAILVAATGGVQVDATFVFNPQLNQLDQAYDFRWVNIERDYALLPPSCVAGGSPPCGKQVSDILLGALPAIDPKPGGVGINDAYPFYFTDEEDAACTALHSNCGTICVPFQSALFCDNVIDSSKHSAIRFSTLIVATSDTDPQLGLHRFCILGGFDWIDVSSGDGSPSMVSLCGEAEVPSSLANLALMLADAPGFPAWEAVDGCILDYPGAFIDLGQALAGSLGAPILTGSGSLHPGTPVTFALGNALSFAPAYLLIGVFPLNGPFKGGVMVPDPDLILGLTTNASGAITLNGMWPSGIPAGTTTYYQWWIADAAGPVGFAASNAISGTTP